MTPQKKSVNALHDKEKTVKKFFNKAQRDAMAISAHDEYIVAARGTGKSEGIDARFIIRNVWSMPGSTGALISPTYSKAWANTLPAICHGLLQWGYIEGVHYYVGRKAPQEANFKQPKRKPLRTAWSSAIHFWNGTIMVILSFNQGMSANSMSLDWLIGPEAKYLDYDKIKSEVNPANRGNKQYFDFSPYHHSVLYTTDMPTSKMGRWILDKKKEMNPEHINFIRNLYKILKDTEAKASKPFNLYYQTKINQIREELNTARKYQRPIRPTEGKQFEYTVFYGEYDIFDNLEVVGEDFIWQMYRDSPNLIWRTAFLNEPLLKVPNGFYSSLSDNHFYIPKDNGTPKPNPEKWRDLSKIGCLSDEDLNPNEPLYIACDSNAAISTLCVGQFDKPSNTMKTIKSFFVKTPNKLQDLTQDFCNYYTALHKKQVILYFDHTFTWTSGITDSSYKDTIIKVLQQNRYQVLPIYIGQSAGHEWKHAQIDKALKDDPNYLRIRFNLMQNEFLKIAMEQTGIRQGKNGFEKDKTPEHLPDTPDAPDEHKTHATDAWDTLFIGMNFHLTGFSNPYNSVLFL